MSKARGGGLTSACKACESSRIALWCKQNPEKKDAINQRYYKNNPEQMQLVSVRARALRAIAYAADPKKFTSRCAKWKRNNRGKCNATLAAYKAARRMATPAWANQIAMGEFYAFAAIKSKLTGQKWEVDHQVPITSDIVCGLHTHNNLQVILSIANKQKSNRVWPDMPQIHAV